MTTISFVVERNNGKYDFIRVTTTDKMPEECKAILLKKGLFKSAQISDVYTGISSNSDFNF